MERAGALRFTTLIRLAYVVARRRMATDYWLELAIVFGMVLAVALLVGGVVYSSTLEEAALQKTLRESDPESTSLHVWTFQPASLALSREMVDLVQEKVVKPLELYMRGSSQVLQTSTFLFEGLQQEPVPTGEGGAPIGVSGSGQPRGKLQHIVGVESQVQLLEGRYPEGGGYPIEVMVEEKGLDLLGLSVGDELTLAPTAVVKDPTPIVVRIVGSLEVIDPSGEFWSGPREVLSYKGSLWPWVPMFITQEAFLQQIATRYPEMYTDVSWHFYLDRENLRARQAGPLVRRLRQAQAEVAQNLSNGRSSTKLPRILERYQEEVTLARVPLQLVVALGVCIVLYYVFLVSVLIVRSRGPELALLKSRGATTSQIILLMLVEGVLLAIPAVALGPFVSLGVVTTLGKFFSGTATHFSVVPVALSLQSFALGAGGGLLCVLTLTLSAFLTARRGIVEFRQAGARPPVTSFVHRYYLDLLILALIGLLWWQVEQQGAFLVRPLGEAGLSMDFSLLLGPVLAFLALGLLALRIFPLALKVIARLAEPLRSTWLVQGLRQISRDPLLPGALVVLLMLATMLGVIGGTFRASLEASQRDRAYYAAGADLRLIVPRGPAAAAFLAAGRRLPYLIGDNPHTMVLRETGTITAKGMGERVTVLGVESDAFAEAAWYRSDFTSPPMPRAVKELDSYDETARGIELPEYARTLGIWVRPSRPDPKLHLVVRFRDYQGEYFNLDMGDLGFSDWKRLEADLSWMRPLGRRGFQFRGRPPLTIVSLFLSSKGSIGRGAIYLDQMDTHVRGFDKEKRVVYEKDIVLADFQSADGWQAMQDAAQPGLYVLETSEAVARPGRKSLVFSWTVGGSSLPGIRPGRGEEPLPALVDKGFLEVADVVENDTALLRLADISVPIRIVGVADYFPTLYPDETNFVVVDLLRLVDYLNTRSTFRSYGPGEVWIHLAEPDAKLTDITLPLLGHGLRVHNIYSASEMVSERVTHPLLVAGWSGLVVLSFFTIVLASASSIMLYSYMDTRERQLEFALLRTLGFTRRQLNGVVWFGLILMVVSGIALGTWAGQVVGAAVLPLLEVAEQGTRVTPPMTLQVNWWTLFWYYGVLALAAVATCAVLARIISRRDIQQVLRLGGV